MRKFILELDCARLHRDGAAPGESQPMRLAGPGFVWLETTMANGRCYSVYFSEDEWRLAEAAHGAGLPVISLREVSRIRSRDRIRIAA